MTGVAPILVWLRFFSYCFSYKIPKLLPLETLPFPDLSWTVSNGPFVFFFGPRTVFNFLKAFETLALPFINALVFLLGKS
ncbi:hypothetical protein ACB098_06G200000 [Castanea mollissima]